MLKANPTRRTQQAISSMITTAPATRAAHLTPKMFTIVVNTRPRTPRITALSAPPLVVEVPMSALPPTSWSPLKAGVSTACSVGPMTGITVSKAAMKNHPVSQGRSRECVSARVH
jgi:hypothetical protein